MRRLWGRREFLQTAALTVAGGFFRPRPALGSGSPRFLPEYESDLSESLLVYDQIESAYLRREVFEVLRHFPAAARFHFLASPSQAEAARLRIEEMGFGGRGEASSSTRAGVVVVDDPDLWGDWGRDISMLAWPEGVPTLLVPYNKQAEGVSGATRSFQVLRALARDGSEEGELRVRQAPLSFEGGNLTYDSLDGERILFTGNTAVLETQLLYARWFGRSLTDEETLELFRNAFDVDRVVPLGRVGDDGRRRQARFLFHIDMALTIIGEGEAVVSRFDFVEGDESSVREVVDRELELIRTSGIDGEVLRKALRRQGIEAGPSWRPEDLPLTGSEVAEAEIERLRAAREELASIRKRLRGMGYLVHDAPTDWRHVRKFQSYTNVLQGRDRVIMPVFPEEDHLIAHTIPLPSGRTLVQVTSSAKPNLYRMTGFNRENYELYQRIGGRGVRVVEDSFYLASGNVHCIVGRMS